MARTKFGRNCKVYHGAAGAQAATLIADVIEATLDLADDVVDVSTRGREFKSSDVALTDATVTIVILRKDSTQTGYEALRAAKIGKTPIALMVLDGDKDDADSQGIDADFVVTGMSRPETLSDGVKITFTCKSNTDARDGAWVDETGS